MSKVYTSKTHLETTEGDEAWQGAVGEDLTPGRHRVDVEVLMD